MEPFTIQCSTCQSRIRVKNPKMIGQLANCPKCSSMIMVAHPQQVRVEAPGGANVDSMAMTKEGIAAPPPFPGEAQATYANPANTDENRGTSASEGHSDDGEYRLAQSEDGRSEDEQSDSDANQEQSAGVQHPIEWQPSEQPLVPSDQWTSEKSTKTRQLLLVATLGITGVVLAIVGFMGFLQWYNKVDESSLAAKQSVGGEVATDDATNNAADSLNDNDDRVSASDTNVTPDNNDMPTSVLPGENMTGEDTLPNALTEDDPTGALSALPPSFTDAGDDSNAGDPTNDAAVDPMEAAKAALPKALQSIADVLDIESQIVMPPEEVIPDAAPVTARELGLSSSTGRPPIAAIDYNQRKTGVLSGVILGGNQSLVDSVNLWVQLSGIPSLVDFDALSAANVDFRALTMSLKSDQPHNLEDLAGALATSAGIVAEPRENRFLAFSVLEKQVADSVPLSIPLDGLLDKLPTEQDRAQWMIQALEKLFPQSTGFWSVSEGNLSREPDSVDLLTWFNVIRMLENWKSQTGINSTVTQFSAGPLKQPFLNSTSVAGLQHVFKHVTPQAHPVGQSLSKLCSAAGIQCWIDWPNVAANGLGPSSVELVVTLNRPLERLLADYLDRFSLVAAIIDEKTIWITTAPAYRIQTRLYVIPSEGRTPEQWEEKLRPLTPAFANGIGQVIVVASPDGQSMLVRCCRPTIELQL